MVSILFKRDASDIDGVNICYLSKLPLHAIKCICSEVEFVSAVSAGGSVKFLPAV